MLHPARTAQWLVVLAAVVSAGPALVAQKVTFKPIIEVGPGYSDNVEYGGSPTTADSSDTVATLRVVLPVTREYRKGRIDFRYEPSFSRYDKRTELDRDEHRLQVTMLAQPRRETNYSLALQFRSSQIQGESQSTDDPDLFIAPRTDRLIATADFTARTRISQRWTWDFGLGGSLLDYDTSSVSSVEDRTEARSAVRFARNLRGRGSSLGFQLAHSEFNLDLSEDSATDSVRAVYNRRLGRDTSISLSLGAYRVDSEAENQDSTGLDFNAAVSRLYRKVLLRVNGRIAPSSGGALLGTSTNSLLALSVSNRDASTWSWRISPRVAERKPNGGTTGTLRTVSIGGDVGRRIARQLRLGLRVNNIDQSTDSTAASSGDSNVLDRKAFTAALALQWFPRGGADSPIR